jgi:hypothetical protein
VFLRSATVAYGNHRLAAVAVGGLTNLSRVTVRGDFAHVVTVRPVAWERGDGREIARSGLVEPINRPAMDARILLVPLGRAVSSAGEDARRGDARYGEDERNCERQNSSFHETS